MPAKPQQKNKKPKAKKVPQVVTVDCTVPAADKILDVAALEKFFHDRVKIDGRGNNFADVLTISRNGFVIKLAATQHVFPKKYIKFLVKKYLKKNKLRDWLRVVRKDAEGYEFKYFNINSTEEADDDDDDDE